MARGAKRMAVDQCPPRVPIRGDGTDGTEASALHGSDTLMIRLLPSNESRLSQTCRPRVAGRVRAAARRICLGLRRLQLVRSGDDGISNFQEILCINSRREPVQLAPVAVLTLLADDAFAGQGFKAAADVGAREPEIFGNVGGRTRSGRQTGHDADPPTDNMKNTPFLSELGTESASTTMKPFVSARIVP